MGLFKLRGDCFRGSFTGKLQFQTVWKTCEARIENTVAFVQAFICTIQRTRKVERLRITKAFIVWLTQQSEINERNLLYRIVRFQTRIKVETQCEIIMLQLGTF